jgi:hypothetical protein
MMKMTKNNITRIILLALPLILVACGSKKKLVTDNNSNGPSVSNTTPSVVSPEPGSVDRIAVINKVNAQAATAKNLVASIDFNIKSGSKDITVDGKLSMRKDEVVRLQLSPLGLMEVGRMEFTRDTVLIIDRMHKQYLKSSYDQVSFLRDNGIDFYALQALFWNQLFMPGEKSVSNSNSSKYNIKDRTISIEKGKMAYQWLADQTWEHITAAKASYNGGSSKSQLDWNYDEFKPFAGKTFPALHQVKVSTRGRVIQVGIKIKNMKEDAKWDTETKVSSKYKPVELKDVINQILKL